MVRKVAYTALYRKYRPTTFDDVVGQHDVVETLKNKVLTGKIGHAILLTGSRGTGKTTLAKIFARAINCLSPEGANPCNKCDICKGILSENLLDVIEMDAASNNGVDDVRSINEKVKFPPVTAKYKVFIVDEVHMMSKAAFNAFLKTLEEPPPYILFIFATTDPQAIPSTILSRCQRFDLKRVPHIDIFKRLETVCSLAGLEHTSDGLEMIVRRADGAVRDALSILDKCSNFSAVIDKETVAKALGLVEDEVLVEISKAIISRDMERALVAVNDVINSGRSEVHFLSDLQDHFRNILMAMSGDSLSRLIIRSESYMSEIANLRKGLGFPRVVDIIERLSDDMYKLKRSENMRITLETSIARLCVPYPQDDFHSVLERLERLERGLANGRYVEVLNGDGCGASQDAPADDAVGDFAVIADASGESPELISESDAGTGIDFDTVRENWDRICAMVGKESKLTQSYLQTGALNSLSDGIIVEYGQSDRFIYDEIRNPSRLKLVESAVAESLGVKIKVIIKIKDEGAKAQKSEDDDVIGFFKGFEDKLEIR
jgi:DNA polymerase III subunit gamma/tau